MTDFTCAWVRDRLPEFTRDALDVADTARVRQHLAECEDCSAETELVLLLARPVAVPAGLEERVVSAVQQSAGKSGIRQWVLAASFAFAAITGSILWQQTRGPVTALPVDGDATVLAWPDDPLLHQMAGIHSLSDEELRTLLEELES